MKTSILITLTGLATFMHPALALNGAPVTVAKGDTFRVPATLGEQLLSDDYGDVIKDEDTFRTINYFREAKPDAQVRYDFAPAPAPVVAAKPAVPARGQRTRTAK